MDSADPAGWRRLFALDDWLRMDVGVPGCSALPAELRADDPVCSTFAEVRRAIAPGFGCDADEIVITASTTDALCKILGGLELRAGDEILTSDHEHWGARAPMALMRDRHGVVVKQIAMPVGASVRAGDVLERFAAAMSPRTRVLLFSSPLCTTGNLLPIAELARLAQERGAVSVLDGAHLFGMLQPRLHESGVDFAAGSGNKWQSGPAGSGFLYLRNKVLARYNARPLPRFWPLVSIWYPVDGGLAPRSWTSEPGYDLAEYLQTIGSASASRLRAVEDACLLWDSIGRDVIERHVLELSAHLRQRIVERWGRRALYSSDDPHLLSALTTFNPLGEPQLERVRLDRFIARLAERHRVLVRYTTFPVEDSPAPHHAVRLATRIFHDRDDVDRLIVAMVDASGP